MADDARALLLRVLTAVLLALAPVVAVALSPWQAITGLVMLGLLPTLTATPSGPRAMLPAAAASTGVALLAVLAIGTGPLIPLVGTLLVVALAFATGALSPRGLHPVGAGTIALAAYLLVDPSRVLSTLATDAPIAGLAGAVAAVVLLACGWVVGVTHLLLRGVRLPASAPAVTLPYGVLLAVLCGVFMLACLLWLPGTNAWWTVMTVAMILQPTHADTRTKINGRIAGTVLGGTAAALVASVLPTWAAVPVGVVASTGAVLLLLAGSGYWQYSTAVTMSVVLLTFDPETLIAGDLQRVGLTVIAAAVTAATVWAASRLTPAAPPAE